MFIFISNLHRSSRSNIIFKTAVLKNFVNFTGGLRPAILSKRDSNASTPRCFPTKFANFLRTPVFTEPLVAAAVYTFLIYPYLSIIYL